jgi:hypothetical protein
VSGSNWTDAEWTSVMDEPMDFDADFDPEELREFLAADLVDVPVRPGFREQLRRTLWRMVKLRYGRDPNDSN